MKKKYYLWNYEEEPEDEENDVFVLGFDVSWHIPIEIKLLG